ncbi:PucR C-terminal helix-turn-helix domain-containing protein [Actinacidiphila yanglinensis]|uniref:PucR C-terminal helix-turn-helix domain-containing protein n=1 Tax=Actinacidiphila yanglinensis TaxID=310779 RepID=A0A1H6E774_9ACTN|nr:helix-turn-helix domain-containing protein [Actinacidiphila yanglinensis]SEG93103.1 PucR C-terminal helix-turn-helix domain-containing protein [Actinacidiphila yanglinensis]
MREMVTVRTDVGPSEPGWLGEMTGAIAAEVVQKVFPSQKGRGGFHAQVSRFVRSDLARVASAANGQQDLAAAHLNLPAEYGRWLAECGFPASAVRDAYWIGMRQMLEQWAKRGWTGAVVDATGGNGATSETVALVTTAAFDCTERGIKRAAGAYDARLAELRGQGSLRRRAVVQEILGSAVESGGEAEAALGYRLSQSHVCVLLHPSEPDEAKESLRAARSETGAVDLLAVALGASWCTWLGYGMAAGVETAGRLRDVLREAGVRATIGGPRDGTEGFRRAYREARRAEDLTALLAGDGTVLSYHDVALEDVLLQDPARAAQFAGDELGAFALDSPRAARMRETLYTWLSTGSRTVTATRLGVHENTVRQRLRSAADVLGANYQQRRTELLSALKIRCALGPMDAPPTAPAHLDTSRC